VLVTSPGEGDGKSTVARNLAAAAALGSARVLLVEADLRNPSFARLMKASSTVGLSHALAGLAQLEDVVQRVPVIGYGEKETSDPIVDVITAGPLPPNPADLVGSDRMLEIIRNAERRYELVVIDTPPTLVVSDAIPIVNQVSGVIVVTHLGKTTRDAATHLRNQLDHLGAHTLGVVVNYVGRRSSYYGYGYGYGYQPAERPSLRDGSLGIAMGAPRLGGIGFEPAARLPTPRSASPRGSSGESRIGGGEPSTSGAARSHGQATQKPPTVASQLSGDAPAGAVTPDGQGNGSESSTRLILTRRIFKAMEREFDPKEGEGVDAVVHWEIGGRGDGGVDRWQVVISDGNCRAARELDREPTVTIKLDGLQLLELVTGIASGPELFISGKLKMEGDVVLAARLVSLFRIPQPATRP
jgi:capsular exopolysaccharide synthesis family protein